jgi:hypothetical protein
VRTSIAALTVVSLLSILTATVARAAPTQVNVRIEGKAETLFEGPIWTEGHDVLASSDTKQRPCDGIDPLDPQNQTPGPTPTAASVDAMGIIGETFDGQWYPGYNDYFITRWGPDQEAGGMSWGILVNNVFTDVGGCQYELSAGDEALWAYNAFGHKPFLALLPVTAHYTSGARPLTATAELGKPFEVEVLNYSDDEEDDPPAVPERTGSAPVQGADVSPVTTSAKGFETVQAASPQTVTTNARGKTTLVFQSTGWHRIKASAFDGEGTEDAIRSNRLDVCVPAGGETGCGEPPAEDRVRVPQSLEAEIAAEEARHREEAAKSHEEELGPSPPPANPTPTPQGGSGAPTSPAPSGSGQPTDSPGSVARVGTALDPYDDRWSTLRYRGHWRQIEQPDAWLGTVSRGSVGARVSLRLSAGRPVFLLRAMPHRAQIEIRTGSRRQVFAIARGASAAPRLITAASRSRTGTVILRILEGTVDLDGVAVEP